MFGLRKVKPESNPMMNKYELHPLCTLFPRLSGSEFDTLRDDIKVNGLRSPIVLHEGMILDGGNRYRACLEAGIEPEFITFDGGNLVSFVLSANLHRRHMSAGQQAAIVASAQDWAKAQTHGGDRKNKQAATLPLETVEDRMAQSGASDKTQRMADKVAKANPELAKRVAHGEVSLPKAVAQVEGKNKPANVSKKKDEPANEPEMTADDEVSILADEVVSLSEENNALKDRIAASAMDATEEEKTSALETITFLRAEVKRLEIENKALTDSRNSYQRECAELKRQCAMQRRQLEKVSRVA